MGQASRRREAVRAAMLPHLAAAARPPCVTETALRRALAGMPHATVPRAGAAVLAAMGMEPMDCHENWAFVLTA